jgi:uncharacterized protein (DUF58 family)
MQIFNQYSAVWIAAFLVAIVGVILLRRNPNWLQFLAFGVFVFGLVVAWIFLRPQQTTQVRSVAQIQASIGQGTPVLLEVQSPY